MMPLGIGGSDPERELTAMTPLTSDVVPITDGERRDRRARAQSLMAEGGIDALYLDASTSLFYFTGVRLRPSERLHGAILPRSGEPVFITPAFEEPSLRLHLPEGSAVRAWEEDENPASLVVRTIRAFAPARGRVALDPMTPFFIAEGFARVGEGELRFENGQPITAACRTIKSASEIELLKRSNAICLAVHKAVARILIAGITTAEVAGFIPEAFRRLGGTARGSIVLFGEATAHPHGVPHVQTLRDGDMVLVDMSAELEGYRSDITRSYVYGRATDRQRAVWEVERAALMAGFAAARPGAPCEAVDAAARDVVERAGFGPGYALPGLPHRTGHGIGLDVHEEAYIVKGNMTPLAPGMCFSDEPTICIYGEFGIRLEDCIYMSEDGPRWFTEPSASFDDPLSYGDSA